MFAVAAPPETLASAFKMTCASEGHAVDLAWVTGAFELMDASRQKRRIHGLGSASALCEGLKPVPYFSRRLQRLFLLQERRSERAQLSIELVEHRFVRQFLRFDRADQVELGFEKLGDIDV